MMNPFFRTPPPSDEQPCDPSTATEPMVRQPTAEKTAEPFERRILFAPLKKERKEGSEAS